MTVKEHLIRMVPKSLELPARYQYNKLLGRLEREAGIIETIVSNTRRCVDIGANVGLYTYRFSQLFQEVESFEPIPRCAQVIAASELKNVNLHRVALSSRPGRAMLQIPVTGGPGATAMASLSNQFHNAELLTVELRTLDSFCFTEVDLVKIDVEGHELEVLHGGVETFAREQPTIMVEIEQRHHPGTSIENIFDFILNLGYGGYYYSDGRLNPLSSFSVERHQTPFDPLDRARYVNNFIFRSAR